MATKNALARKNQERPKGILVVEDDVSLRFALAKWFRLLRFTVYEAATADEAVTLLKSTILIDAVITDINMPGTMNGLDLVTFIEGASPGTPVIVVSGQDHQISEGDVLFFKKPYKLQEVSVRISKLLEIKSVEPDCE